MAKPASKSELKDYILRRLGAPVIQINLDDDQIDDRIDDALQKFRDYHFDGTEHCFYKIKVTQEDLDNKYFTLPDDIVGVTKIFRLSTAPNTSNLFNIRYQIHLNDLFDYSAATYTPYVMAMRHIETLEEVFVGEIPIRFNRHQNILRPDFDWSADAPVGSWIIVDGYKTVDPEIYTDVYDDPWLKEYATALVKRQWGDHLSKYSGMQMPSGVIFNGDKIYNDAVAEIDKLEKELINSYSLPGPDFIG
jgi:hypothetical protein